MPGFEPSNTTLNTNALYYGDVFFQRENKKLFNGLFYSVYLVFSLHLFSIGCILYLSSNCLA